MGMFNNNNTNSNNTTFALPQNDYGVKVEGLESPLLALETDATGGVSDWIEMWDYVGGIRFRGFVAATQSEKVMFVFFDESVVSGDLKAGLMALLELCEVDHFSCDRLVVCIDRQTDQLARETLTKDLGWIGFSLTTLGEFTASGDVTSEKWLFMDMET